MVKSNFIMNDNAVILDKDFNIKKNILVDKQSKINSFIYDNGFKIKLTHNIYTEADEPIDEYDYFQINNKIYKIIYLEQFITHKLCHCYECEVISIENIRPTV